MKIDITIAVITILLVTRLSVGPAIRLNGIWK
jgi:hypothetical protein